METSLRAATDSTEEAKAERAATSVAPRALCMRPTQDSEQLPGFGILMAGRPETVLPAGVCHVGARVSRSAEP
ncbi:hypothetical protein NDU88_004965 [Pleurodeles waltl]|uniref:Uncharacterized protein n=1 Tax=Pleurodeles waltl TaxID=8319 RepID=A0AAV7TAX0_PLEWA|nr:hypothetical protein NDU88_004965 [Pleurodeles waltl]